MREVTFKEVYGRVVQHYLKNKPCPAFMQFSIEAEAKHYYDELVQLGQAVELVHAVNSDKGYQAYCIIKAGE